MGGRDDRIRAVFFDFGGVIARLDREEIRRMEERYGLPQGSVLRTLYASPEWLEAQVGRLPDQEWLEAAGRRLDELAGRPIPGIRREWQRIWRTLDERVVDLARRLRRSYRIGLLSNSTRRLEGELLGPTGLGDLFDVVVNSARVGIAKPDVRIYRLAAERIGAEPTACVHIDDLPANVEGAREAGFHAVHYRGDYSALERELRALGVKA